MEKTELAIWQRVLQQDSAQPEEEWLTERISQELAAQRSYQHMALRQRNHPFPMMARTAGTQAKKLMALRFLLHGTREPVYVGAVADRQSHHAALRGRYEAERLAHQEYDQATRRWPEYGDLFASLADTAQKNRRLLRQAAEQLK